MSYGIETLKKYQNEVSSLKIKLNNAESQVDYMCKEISTALNLPIQSPAGTVQSVRDLAAFSKVK